MVIAIIALAVLLILSFLIIAILWYTIKELFFENLLNNPKEYFNYYLDTFTTEIFEGNLLLSFLPSDQFTGTVYDFSFYEENKLIGLYYYDNKNDNEIEKNIILPNQKIHLMEDGSYQWDFSKFI